MDGGASRYPSMREHSGKRNFSEMSASHRRSHDPSPAPSRGQLLRNDSAARRRRFEAELRPPHIRFPGDGLDFRRPVLSTANNDGGMNIIDLTREDSMNAQQSRMDERQEQGRSAATVAAPLIRSPVARRVPRSERNVIDIESSDDEEANDSDADYSNLPGAGYLALPRRYQRPQYANLRRPARRPSPQLPQLADMDDVEFIEQRPRHHQSQSAASTPLPQRNATPYPPDLGETIDLTADGDDDEVQHLNTRQRGGVNNAAPQPPPEQGMRGFTGYQHMGQLANLLREGGANVGGRLFQRIHEYAGTMGWPGERAPGPQLQRFDLNAAARRHLPPLHAQHHHLHYLVQRNQHALAAAAQAQQQQERQQRQEQAAQTFGIRNDMTQMMNYAMTGFDMGLAGGGHRPPTPKYEPPPPAEAGFTRSPGEDEVVVCPNCGDELATGEEGPKQEIWVVKGCGHAYCGDCAIHRHQSANKKGKALATHRSLPSPFKRCVVEGCGKSTSHKSMIHVYLGS